MTVSTSTLGSSLGTGGMETKLIAAELATAAGCATVITLGSAPSRILSIVQSQSASSIPSTSTSTSQATLPSEHAGVEFSSPSDPICSYPHTLFTPKPRPLTSRRFWILHGLAPRGSIYIDEGAYRAISRGERDGGGGGNGGRLLAAGVLRVEGTFAAGQAVRVLVCKGKWGGRRGGRKGDRAAGGEASRPGSPDHFLDRKVSEGNEILEGLDNLELKNGEVLEDDEEELEQDVFEFGRGLTNYNSLEIDRVKGLRRLVKFRLYCRDLFPG